MAGAAFRRTIHAIFEIANDDKVCAIRTIVVTKLISGLLALRWIDNKSTGGISAAAPRGLRENILGRRLCFCCLSPFRNTGRGRSLKATGRGERCSDLRIERIRITANAGGQWLGAINKRLHSLEYGGRIAIGGQTLFHDRTGLRHRVSNALVNARDEIVLFIPGKRAFLDIKPARFQTSLLLLRTLSQCLLCCRAHALGHSSEKETRGHVDFSLCLYRQPGRGS